MDLGLINDVQQSEITINGKTVTYKYDKRLANGGAFQFGVNKYDLGNAQDSEETYADYHKKLSNGDSIKNEVEIDEKDGIEDYTNYLRKEDITPNQTPGESENGSAVAGGYGDYDVSIKLTYKIMITNQSQTPASVTEIVDYYSKDFKLSAVYEGTEREKGNKISSSINSKYSDRDIERLKATSSDYNTIYIPLDDTKLKNGEKKYYYIELEMIEPRTTLNGKLEGDGYKTLNYAEINGYKTDIGVIDIDSMPGNIIDDGKDRFAFGKYEDDESKSPTFIFKNPENASRTIKGTVFEDSTGEVKIGESRDGDGEYKKGETGINGATVELIEITQSGEAGMRAKTKTVDGDYEFTAIVAGDYKIKFTYGDSTKTVLTTKTKEPAEGKNEKSYNGQDYENTIVNSNIAEGKYWYSFDPNIRYSDAIDDQGRRNEVIKYSQTLGNHELEVFNSWKDTKVNTTLVQDLIDYTNMYANTEKMSLEVEDYTIYRDTTVTPKDDGTYDYEYIVKNIDFGIVERERAELQITKKVSKISIVDSSGKVITEGTEEDIQKGLVKYIKMVPNDYENKKQGFVDMEIDSELLSGATLKVTYEIIVTNTSEAGNTISNIEVIDYVSNNLNFDQAKNGDWNPVKVDDIESYLSNTNMRDKTDIKPEYTADLSTYQTILMTTFGELAPNKKETKYLVLEKNLSSSEDSDFNYENQVEIVQSYNANGRGDYSSIYGNLDPLTYTSRQGNLNWDNVGTENEKGIRQMATVTELDEKVDNSNAIRVAEKDSGNAEEVVITPPTGATGLVLQTQHYILALTFLTTLAGTIILIKKYMSLAKQ